MLHSLIFPYSTTKSLLVNIRNVWMPGYALKKNALIFWADMSVILFHRHNMTSFI